MFAGFRSRWTIPLLVGSFEGVCDLLCDRQRFVQGNRSPGDSISEGRPVDEFHHQRGHTGRILEPVNVRDVRVVERGQQLRLATEPRETFRIIRERFGQHLDGDVATELGVSSPIDLAHPARAEQRDDFIRAEAGAASQSQAAVDYTSGTAARTRSALSSGECLARTGTHQRRRFETIVSTQNDSHPRIDSRSASRVPSHILQVGRSIDETAVPLDGSPSSDRRKASSGTHSSDG